MNESDSEIVNAILLKSGMEMAKSPEESDLVLLNTCAIREGAETKIWNRLSVLKHEKTVSKSNTIIGVLGCMAERLKETLVEK